MGVAAAVEFVKNLLDGLQMPPRMNAPALAAWVIAPDPDVEVAERPTAYVWEMPAEEHRLTPPRNTGRNTPAGFKETMHVIGVWLVWDQAEDDPDGDTLYNGYLDALLDALRTAWPMPADITDPWTGEVTTLVDMGERVSYDSPPPRTIADQRYLRFDALVKIPVCELIRR